jgi:hypothetical protein
MLIETLIEDISSNNLKYDDLFIVLSPFLNNLKTL